MRLALVLAVLLGGLAATAQPKPPRPRVASPAPVVVAVSQPLGPPRPDPPLPWWWIAPRGAVVAATHEDGRPWDGTGLFVELVTELHAQLPQVRDRLFNAILPGQSALLAQLLPLAVGFFQQLWAAPEVALTIRVNGTERGGPRVFEDVYAPQWDGAALTDPVHIPDTARVEFVARDRDATSDELVGTCTLQGPVAVDADGYLPPSALTCSGGLLAVRVQAWRASTSEVERWWAWVTANRRAGLPDHGAADCPPAGSPGAGPGGRFPGCAPPRW